jgi:fatty acid desaturase
MNGLCRYKDALGVPGRGVHAWRIFDVAIVDVVLTVLAAWGIAEWRGWPFWWVLLGLFVMGIVLHRLFCVRTTVDQWLRPRGSKIFSGV